jgi:hypothetical protein
LFVTASAGFSGSAVKVRFLCGEISKSQPGFYINSFMKKSLFPLSAISSPASVLTFSLAAAVSLCLLSACGGAMQSTRPVGADSIGAVSDNGNSLPLPMRAHINPFSSSSDPVNVDTVTDTLSSAATAGSATSSPSPAPAKAMPKPGSKDFDPSTLAPGSLKQDFVSRGLLIPTVYYKPIFNEDVNNCKDADKVNLRGPKNEVLTLVCPKAKAACELQGSCMIQQKGGITSFNFIDEAVRGYPHFSKVNLDVCPFGLGVQEACLDPFFNVAADLNFFKAGDVIFVPALVGLTLPGGAKHTGFLIVRDSGGGIEGNNRFDFFSGFYDWRDAENPFTKLKLTDKATRLPYYYVKGETASKVKAARNYPSIPGFQKGVSPSLNGK